MSFLDFWCNDTTCGKIKEVPLSKKRDFYAYPAHSFLTITGTETSLITLIIKNINGVEMLQKTILIPTIIDVNYLQNGVYILSLHNNKGYLKVQKLIIQH